jgi:hypothetical protein
MEWISNPVVVGIFIGIASNLLSPLVSGALSAVYGGAKSRLINLSLAGLRRRLEQLKDEYAQVEDLRDNSPRLVSLSMRAVMPVIFITWLIVGVIFYIHIASKSEIPEPLMYALMGIVGLGTRYFVEAMVIWNFIGKVRNFAEFKESNQSEQRKIEAILASRSASNS